MYFSTLGPVSYDLGSAEYESNSKDFVPKINSVHPRTTNNSRWILLHAGTVITDCFGKERLEEYRGKHKLDVMLVYAVNAKVVEQAPGGRSNAKMVSKNMFETFATVAPTDGNCKTAAAIFFF